MAAEQSPICTSPTTMVPECVFSKSPRQGVGNTDRGIDSRAAAIGFLGGGNILKIEEADLIQKGNLPQPVSS